MPPVAAAWVGLDLGRGPARFLLQGFRGFRGLERMAWKGRMASSHSNAQKGIPAFGWKRSVLPPPINGWKTHFRSHGVCQTSVGHSPHGILCEPEPTELVASGVPWESPGHTIAGSGSSSSPTFYLPPPTRTAFGRSGAAKTET